MPQASFDFTANGLTVKFINLSTDATTFSWNFGDNSGLDLTENPEHTYQADGVYPVELTATKDAVDSKVKFSIVVTTENRVNLTIRDMVKFEAPSIVDTNPIGLTQKIKAWQIYLQPLVDAPYAPIEPADAFNEWKWPSIFNQLIAKLVIWELVVGGAGKTAIQQGSTSSGGLKSIETGPSKAEWYDASTMWKDMMSEGGFIDNMTQELCMVAALAGIQLPMCPVFTVRTETFIVGKKCNPVYNPWPISKG
jgi:PKD repeat protein